MRELYKHSVKREEQSSDFDLKKFLMSYVKYWWAFALCVAIGLSVAYIMNFYAIPYYTVQSKSLIESDDDRVIYSESAVPDLNFINRTKTVDNEVEIFVSRDMIDKTLKQLDFKTTYYQYGNFKVKEMYNDCPFKVFYDTLRNINYYTEYKITILDEKRFRLQYSPGKNPAIKHDKVHHWGEFIGDNGLNIQVNKNPHVEDYFNYNNLGEGENAFSFYFNFHIDMVNSYMGKVRAEESNKETDIIVLSMDDVIPERGIVFMNKLQEVYIEEIIKEKREIAQNMHDFIEERLKINWEELQRLEGAIANYKRNKGVINVQDQANFILEGIKKFEYELSDAETQLTTVKSLLTQLFRGIGNEVSIPKTVLGVHDPLLDNIIVALNAKETELAKKRNTVKPNNPVIIELEAEIEDLRISLHQNLISHEKNLEIAVQDIKDRIEQYNRDLAALTNNDKDLVTLGRLRDTHEGIYLHLLKKREEAAMALASKVVETKIIEKPFFTTHYYKPQKTIVLLLGLFMGIFIPLLIITLKDLMNDKISELDFVRKNTSIPVVGVISKNKGKEQIVINKDINSSIAEEYRTMNFNLQYMGSPKRILVTSGVSGEGKTFTTLNLGITSAILGNKTCIVELELRRPKISKGFGRENTLGVTNYLIGKKTYYEIIQQSEITPRLDYISAGPIPPNPSELLIKEELEQLLEFLDQKYDTIILDSPPISMVSDAYILEKLVDTTIFVIRNKFTKKNKMDFVNQLHENRRFGNMCIVYNCAQEGEAYGAYYLQDSDPILKNRLIRAYRKLKKKFKAA
ncbi:MAG: polysaccharide biosynthesis tyrosine autokinase [Bacteroidota bacterium]